LLVPKSIAQTLGRSAMRSSVRPARAFAKAVPRGRKKRQRRGHHSNVGLSAPGAPRPAIARTGRSNGRITRRGRSPEASGYPRRGSHRGCRPRYYFRSPSPSFDRT
jgi:hypothetical protein